MDLKKRWTVIVSLVFLLLIVASNVFRSYETNQLLSEHAARFFKLKQIIDTRLQGKTLRVRDDVTYDYLLFYQGQEKKYKLIYTDQQTTVKEDMVLDNYRRYKSTDGFIVWTDHKDVLYIPK